MTTILERLQPPHSPVTLLDSKEIEELADDAAAEIRRLQDRVATLDQRARRLHDALSVYGQHLDDCGDQDAYNRTVHTCGCGLDAIERECAPEPCDCGERTCEECGEPPDPSDAANCVQEYLT